MTPIPHQQSDIGKALKKTGLYPNKKPVIQERKYRKNKQTKWWDCVNKQRKPETWEGQKRRRMDSEANI